MAPIWLAFALIATAETQPVTVEIVTVGHSETAPQRFDGRVYLSTTATTQADAAALFARRKAELIEQLKAAGASIATSGDMPTVFFPSPPLISPNIATGDMPKKTSSGTIKFTAPDRATLVRIKAVVAKTDGARIAGEPSGTLADPVTARRAAKADGLEKARAEAQAYAAKLGLPVITLLEISEKGDLGSIFLMSQEGRASPFGANRLSDGLVPTDVPMTVTFRLDPK